MPCSIATGSEGFSVLVIDPPALWWGAIPGCRAVATVHDRNVAHRIARLLESVERAVQIVVVNEPDALDQLRQIAEGRTPITALEVADELADVDRPPGLDPDGPYPLRLDDLFDELDEEVLPQSVRDVLPAVGRQLVGTLVERATDPTSRLAGLRACSQRVLARAARAPLDEDDRVRLRPDIDHERLICERCLCQYTVFPDCTIGPGVEPFGAPATLSLLWHPAGLRLAESRHDVDECPCHGESEVLAWADPDSRVLAEVLTHLTDVSSAGEPLDARLMDGSELVVALASGRQLAVRRGGDGRWEYVCWDGDRAHAPTFTSRDVAADGALRDTDGSAPTSPAQIARAVRAVVGEQHP
ncbi:hypothetical protein [Cellulomonas sp. URHB0016]